MNQKSKIRLTVFVLLTAILACNSPLANPPQEAAPEIQTAAAQTLQVMLTPSISATIQQPLIVRTTNTSAATATKVGAVTQTPTYSVPMLTVLEQTNCRAGPGQDYEILFTYLAGKKLEIVGRYDPDNYWLVKSAESPIGTCWLWGEYVEVTGSYGAVPSVTPPATVTSAPPQAPSIVEYKFSCADDGTITFIVSWVDKANNETGYRVFRNGESVAELPANSSSYTETMTPTGNENVDYYLQVYSPFGSANSSIIRINKAENC